MAIIKRAKNLIVNIKNEYRHFSGSYECVSDEVQIIATEGNLTLTSAKKIAVKKGSDNTTAKSAVEQDKKQRRISSNYQPVNGCFYTADGTFLGKEYFYIGDPNDVYICTEKEYVEIIHPTQIVFNKNLNSLDEIAARKGFWKYKDLKKLTIKGVDIKNDTFLRIAGLAFSETGFAEEAIKKLPYTIFNHYNQLVRTSSSITKPNKTKIKDLTWRAGILDDVIIKMRNNWDDPTYAKKNSAFREFLGINDGETINYDKNALDRNLLYKTITINSEKERKYFAKLAIKSTIDAFNYFDRGSNKNEDISKSAIGWHGIDIVGKEDIEKQLFVDKTHIFVYGNKKWINKITEGNSDFISVSVYNGIKGYGPTLFYKTTKENTRL